MKIKLFTIPNIITLGNLLCGCLAIVFVSHDIRVSFWLIMLAAVLDFFDGFAARMLKSYSDIGKQLDSLSDMVSFGVAPSMILYHMMIISNTIYDIDSSWTWTPYLVFIVALFSALRLAKFNIDESQKDEFVGLPTPACGIFMAATGYLVAEGSVTLTPWFIVITSLLFAYLLISPVRMFSLKFHNFSFKSNVLRYGFLIFAALTILVCWYLSNPVAAIPVIIFGYILTSMCRNIAQAAKR